MDALDQQIADFTAKLCTTMDAFNEQVKEINNDLRDIQRMTQ